ncbi:tRNA guanosine(34) transglycosylase Tgt [Prosthecomicrobium hirschii]|uniref:tRNA guanosine(34) transglycosylase Tgt n=1 Tax=Prosthecodimorpha hirschii TaxID=665126 RepID=UPI00221E6889|nr:tRNA guanosine(34) transglycosylase Tgt [Prosthecomicrobium hirschii]MCW1839860.1 tRNA guanosine(34) transglycosylase Tgt [Prosthecomicrobium hirschii]
MTAPTELAAVPAFGFRLIATDGMARRGEVTTAHGAIRTPAFMPVGTQATVKTMYPEQVRALGADILLGNTYHLMLRPTAERVDRLGGLHRFMNWPHPILTDSGGFQVMSLAKLRKLNEQAVTFQSHIDGSRHVLSPERSLEIQGLLGSDIQMQLDECVALPAERAEIERAMRLSLRWAERSKAAFFGKPGHGLFAIVQGGDDEALRVESARALTAIGFHGYAVGGLAVGEPQDVMLRILSATTPELPEDRPRYLMGVGTPDDIVESVGRGIDMFDCVMPTRAGRHGQAFTRRGKVNLRNARHADDPRPIDEESTCPAARDYSRAYLHHLVKAEEALGAMLLTWINLSYYQDLMAGLRAAIEAGRFQDHKAAVKDGWARGDLPAL